MTAYNQQQIKNFDFELNPKIVVNTEVLKLTDLSAVSEKQESSSRLL
jgi:hypothetical protein